MKRRGKGIPGKGSSKQGLEEEKLGVSQKLPLDGAVAQDKVGGSVWRVVYVLGQSIERLI